MAHQPMHPPLSAHNARVRRLARDYDKKYRPVLIPIAKHLNMETGESFPRVATIMRESARYTDKRKPLSRSQVFKLLAEMTAAGAIKTEARFSPTGRQRSSYRYLDLHVAIRFGLPVEHLWDAPLPEDETPDETLPETPGETPDETPITLPELSSDSRMNSPTNSFLDMKIVGDVIPLGKKEEGPTGYNNSYLVGTSRKHPDGYFRKASDLPRRGESRVDLSVDEARFMWTDLRSSYNDQVAFLKGSARHRAILVDGAAQRAAEARAEADRQAEEERAARRAAELEAATRAEAEREAKRAALRAELDRLSDRYDELTGCPGDAKHILGYLNGPNGKPPLSKQVAYLKEKVDQREYYEAHKDDPPWTGDVSTLKPGRSMTAARLVGKTRGGFVGPGGTVRETWGRSGIRPGEVFGYFRWTPNTGLELAEPDDQ